MERAQSMRSNGDPNDNWKQKLSFIQVISEGTKNNNKRRDSQTVSVALMIITAQHKQWEGIKKIVEEWEV